MRLKKLTAVICTIAMAMGMVAGCGSSSQTSNTNDNENKVTTATGDSNTYNHQAIENAGDITITMMVSGVETDNDFETVVLPKMVKEKWPNVTLEVTKLPDDNYYTTLKTRLASGECPDIILAQPMWAGSNSCYGLAEAGYLADLGDMDCLKQIKDISGMTYKNKVYGISTSVSILGTYYNKDLFNECGITKVPTTWDEFLTACEKLKAAGHQPIVMGDKDQYVLQFGLYQLACNEIYSKNPNYDDQLRDGTTKFTDKGTWDHVLEMYKELYDKGYIDASQSLGTGASQAIQSFIDGNAAMTFDGAFNVKAILAEGKAGKFDRGFFPLPGDQGDGNVYTATCLAAGYGIYADSKRVNECKEILDYLYDGKSDLWDAYVADGKNIVTYGEGADKLPNYSLFKPFIQLMNEGKAYHWCNQAWPAGTETIMEVLFSEMVGGQKAKVDDITKGMQEKFEDLLDK